MEYYLEADQSDHLHRICLVDTLHFHTTLLIGSLMFILAHCFGLFNVHKYFRAFLNVILMFCCCCCV